MKLQDFILLLQQRKRYLDEHEPITEITMESVLSDIESYENLSEKTEDDIEFNHHDRDLLAMLQEGYNLAWGQGNLYINGIARNLPSDMI